MLEYPPGSTPLAADEADALVPKHIKTQSELNEVEQANILKGQRWAYSRRRSTLLTERFVRRLHEEMFDETWHWAGEYRRSDKNLGVPWYTIPERVAYTCQTVQYWTKEKTYALDETAVRLHHLLVSVHPFPNGNGRHTRLMADLLLWSGNEPLFSWGGSNLIPATKTRETYIKALSRADGGDIGPLLKFARS